METALTTQSYATRSDERVGKLLSDLNSSGCAVHVVPDEVLLDLTEGRDNGAIVGLVCGLTVVVAINYWQEITGSPGISFLWAMPLCLIVEVSVGALVSLIPIGRKRSRLRQ